MKALFLLLTISFTFGSMAQKVPQSVNTWYRFWGVNTDSIHQLPRIAPRVIYRDTGDLYFSRIDRLLHWWTGDHDTTFSSNSTIIDSLRGMLRNSFQNDTDIVMMGGTVRMQTANPNTWAWVSQVTPDHYTLGFDSLVVHNLPSGGFTVLYPHQMRPITFLVVPDESLVQSGWQMGASVGLDSAQVTVTRSVYTGAMVWFNNLSPSFLDIYWANGFSAVTYDTATGKFTATLAPTIARYLSSKPSVAVGITSINDTIQIAIDGNATFADADIRRVTFYALNRTTGARITHIQPLQPVCDLNGPAYWTQDETGMPTGSSNYWIFGMFRKYQ